MLHKSFIPEIIFSLSRRNKHILNIYYSSINNTSHVTDTKNINTSQIKINNIELKEAKKTNFELYPIELFDVVNHVQRLNLDAAKICPTRIKYCKTNTSIDSLYLINRFTAAKYVSLIIDDLSKNMCFVTELNPGFGLLTIELLKAGVPLIHLYEAKKALHPILNAIHHIYPGKLDLRSSNLLKISTMFYKDKINDENQVQEVLQGIESKKWEDETCMQVIGAANNKTFCNHLVQSLLYRNCFMSYGRPVFYIAIPPSLWHSYNCDHNNRKVYTSIKVMFQILFDYKLLGILDRKSFLPWLQQKNISGRNQTHLVHQQNYEQMYLVKFEPKADLYSELSQEEWITFWYFLRHHMQKRCTRVIPELEKWIPGCGIRLIAKDYTIFTEFGDLTPVQLKALFKEFKSWPEYKESYFLASMKESLKNNELEFLELHKLKMIE